MKILITIITTLILLTSCGHKAKSEQIAKIEIGMKLNDVFEILYETGWDDYSRDLFYYPYNYTSPAGYKRTFWVIVDKDSTVINTYSIR